jgi:hypothetical protein
VERLRSEVDSVRPSDGARLLVDPDLSEVRRIAERCEYTTPVATGKIDIAYRPIFEGEAKTI